MTIKLTTIKLKPCPLCKSTDVERMRDIRGEHGEMLELDNTTCYNCDFTVVGFDEAWNSIPREPSWQPIETAPKDGAWALTACNGSIEIGQFIRGFTVGWWSSYSGKRIRPTHYMLLPEPPKGGDK